MSQTKLQSLSEALLNLSVGMVINIFANLLILPFFDIKVSISTSIKLTLVFTLISLARSYLLRRAFNSIKNK